jgi:hypothetical protein
VSFPPLFPRGGASQPLYPSGWDRVTLGGILLPGKAQISGLGIKAKLNPKEKNGANGGNPTFHGLEAQTGSIKVTCVMQDQLEELAQACALLLPIPGSTYAGQSLSIESPQLDALGCVTSVVVEGATPITRTSSGAAEMTIQVRHWLPAQAAKTKGRAVTKTPQTPVRRPPNAITDPNGAGAGTVLRNPDGRGTVIAPSSDSANFAPPNYGG